MAISSERAGISSNVRLYTIVDFAPHLRATREVSIATFPPPIVMTFFARIGDIIILLSLDMVLKLNRARNSLDV